jgi:uncharacterized protein YndB with AHSA1/START domain
MPALETAPTSTSTVPTFMLTQTRVIRAPRARVYEAWTNPEIVKKWFGPAGKTCPGFSADVRVDGAYRVEVASCTPVTAADGSECEAPLAVATGNYTKVVPNELLQFTWTTNWSPGEDSIVTVSLKDVDGGTEITILHENFNTEASRDGHNQGWAGCLDKLAALYIA